MRERLEALIDYNLVNFVKFRSLWEITELIFSVLIYKEMYKTATIGRIVCISDSIFKVSFYHLSIQCQIYNDLLDVTLSNISRKSIHGERSCSHK